MQLITYLKIIVVLKVKALHRFVAVHFALVFHLISTILLVLNRFYLETL